MSTSETISLLHLLPSLFVTLYHHIQVCFIVILFSVLHQDENNELVASVKLIDAYAIADFISVSPYVLSVRLAASWTFLYVMLECFTYMSFLFCL